MQGAAPSNDVCQMLRDWYERVPAVANIVMYTLFAGYLIAWTSIGEFFLNVPEAVVAGQLWRLLTASVYCSMILNLLFNLLMYMPTACDTERRMGSIKYLVYFFCNCLLLQLMYVALAYALYFADVGPFQQFGTSGLWGVIMLEIVVRCNRDPEAAVAMWCCPTTIKSKYYPWFLLLLFSLLGFSIMLLLGMMAGYLYVFDLIGCTQLSDTTATRLQDSFACKWLKGVKGFVSVENSGLPFTVVQRVQSTAPPRQAAAQPQFVPFSGRGFTITDANAPSAPRLQPNRYASQQDEDEF